ncbi:MAG: type I-A CRISPR-associated protein Cas4/Csa1 [Candidatus Odinarchaeum yellowstonii]|uniref:Type I-A CRISPR-associated protein Cas4/Csa1 n=1 Tax=Odinarchaeota yellowstonii (strain LCB_4) TaxID=1841599 RepID=A0AAF0D294_ODILC|nr:MAG: type I-A CRISPR-associated protein Cas4/Csa1 [Candidatus Odinarchaeum yellowstonii]
MLILDKADIDKRIKLLRQELYQRPISDELRGWNYDKPPIQPFSETIRFGVGELAARYCETLRDIYLKRVLNVKPPANIKMVTGVALHEVIKNVFFEVKKFIYNNPEATGLDLLNELIVKNTEIAENSINKSENVICKLDSDKRQELHKKCVATYNFLVIQASAKYDQTLSKYRFAESDSIVNITIPPVAERKVDGAFIGLSSELSVDVYTPYNAIIDIKTGEMRKFHPLTAAGYALATECGENTPMDYGFIVYLKFDRKTPSFITKYFIVGDELRREFIEIRDEATQIVEEGNDPGMPAKCPDYCPYYQICHKGE